MQLWGSSLRQQLMVTDTVSVPTFYLDGCNKVIAITQCAPASLTERCYHKLIEISIIGMIQYVVCADLTSDDWVMNHSPTGVSVYLLFFCMFIKTSCFHFGVLS